MALHMRYISHCRTLYIYIDNNIATCILFMNSDDYSKDIFIFFGGSTYMDVQYCVMYLKYAPSQ